MKIYRSKEEFESELAIKYADKIKVAQDKLNVFYDSWGKDGSDEVIDLGYICKLDIIEGCYILIDIDGYTINIRPEVSIDWGDDVEVMVDVAKLKTLLIDAKVEDKEEIFKLSSKYSHLLDGANADTLRHYIFDIKRGF